MAKQLPTTAIIIECVGCKDRAAVLGMNEVTIREWRGLRKCTAPTSLGRNRDFLGFCPACVTKFSVEGEQMAPPIKPSTGGD